MNQGDDAALAKLRPLARLFPDRLYLELTRCGRDGEENWNAAALALAAELGLPVLASNDVRFLKQDDFEAHEARVCINQGRVLADPKRPREYSDQQYLKTPEEMAALFADLPEALENTVELAKRCNLNWSSASTTCPISRCRPATISTAISANCRAKACVSVWQLRRWPPATPWTTTRHGWSASSTSSSRWASPATS